ncbi:hypothetical protein TetV_440 [Tetraselmis virus 1]|uniref:Uncharacterized protein n=1 Tax=Tetraselmis virus 1 TaxID=2060617 RepID=A0A2P0VNR3_9VIRU|nr:hypothetical protein QJ968_gp614 [Tetraselmis virus 1]AUF82522.1 hypothetical protein TetV_440 [Tetraselmis virus 1]
MFMMVNSVKMPVSVWSGSFKSTKYRFFSRNLVYGTVHWKHTEELSKDCLGIVQIHSFGTFRSNSDETFVLMYNPVSKKYEGRNPASKRYFFLDIDTKTPDKITGGYSYMDDKGTFEICK